MHAFRILTVVLFCLAAHNSFSAETNTKKVGLQLGESAPQLEITDIHGNSIHLPDDAKTAPIIVVFYRGGWCPYCNAQLRAIEKDIVPKLKTHPAKIIAISADRVQEAKKTLKEENLSLTIISDPDLVAHKAFDVVFKVPEPLVKKYKEEYDIDLEAASGKTHHKIAIPAVYLIGTDGKIKFAYADENYKVRAQNEDILKALESLK